MVGDTLKLLLWLLGLAAMCVGAAVGLYSGLQLTVLPECEQCRLVAVPGWSFTSCPVVGAPCSFLTRQLSLQLDTAHPTPHSASLSLQLADTPHNRELGMFLVCLTVLPANLTSCSSALLPHQSPLVSHVANFLMLPFHLCSSVFSHHKISVLLLDKFVFPTDSTALRIELQSSRLQVGGAALQIWPSDLSGLKFLMFHHPRLSFLLGVAIILAILFILITLAISRITKAKKVVLVSSGTKSSQDMKWALVGQESRRVRLGEVECSGNVDNASVINNISDNRNKVD